MSEQLPKPIPPLCWTIEQAAARVNPVCTAEDIRELTKQSLGYIIIDARHLIPDEELKDFIRRRTVKPHDDSMVRSNAQPEAA